MALAFVTNSEDIKSIRLEIRSSKAHRRAADPLDRVTPHFVFFPQRSDELDVYKPLQLLFQVLKRDATSWSQPLFPRIVKGAIVEECTRINEYNTWLRSHLAYHRLPVTTAQGLRSGQRSDLTDDGVKEEIILQLGRWKSASASRRYYQTSAECMGALRPKPGSTITSTAPAPAPASIDDEDSDYSSSESEDEAPPSKRANNAVCKGALT